MLSRRHTKDKNIPVNREQSGELLRHLGMFTQLADEGIATFDLKGTIHFVNRAWAKMHGYKKSDELLGKKISHFHTKDQMKSDVIPFMEETKRKGSATGAIEHVRKDGTTFPTQMKTSLLKDEKSQANGLIVIITDITEHKRLEESATGSSKQEEEFKEQIEQLQHQIGEHEQAEENLRQEAAKLTSANEQLQQQIGEQEKAKEGLKQEAAELTTANEQLKDKVIEHDLAEESLKQEAAKITTANEQLKHQNTEHEQVEESLKQEAAKLTATNEQLQQQISEREQAEETLKQESAELTTANEQLQQQITEHEQAEESLKQESDELKSANEQLKNQITEREQAKESFNQEATELKTANEQLKNQITEYEQAEEDLKDLKQQVAELKSTNEQLQKQIVEDKQTNTDLMKHLNMITETIVDMQNKTSKSSGGRERAMTDTDDAEESEQMGGLLDTEQLKSIAELAKRLR